MERIKNTTARHLFMDRHGLAETPTGPAKGGALAALIDRLGFVQIDSIATVERAHHMILFARRQSYRPEDLKRLHEKEGALFEHWTHDASYIPAAMFPHWRLRFARSEAHMRANWSKWFRPGFEDQFDGLLERIRSNGAVLVSDVGEGEERSKGGWWDWHPSKTALEWLWRTGALMIARREGFQKVYDLTERVINAPHLDTLHEAEATVDWAMRGALDRLGFGTPGELTAFWDLLSVDEARDWCRAALARGEVEEVLVEGADGSTRKVLARPGLAEAARAVAEPTSRLRILSPFDPMLRDRKRAEFLFGFFYRIEVFVPEAKRIWGYYVFPVLEGDRLIGRIDMKAHRGEGVLRVRAFWPEAGIKPGAGRRQRLEAELDRMARFAGCERVEFAGDWLRETISAQR